MKPDRTNYEIWLIDYLDGNLDPGQVNDLMAFLDENPDIKEEFYELTKYNIRPADDTFLHKKDLKRSLSEISQSQFEYLCIAALENDLSDPQAAELEEIIAGNPEKRKTFELVRKLKLVAPEVTYTKKHKLRKLTTVQHVIQLSVIGLSAAATVAMMISLYTISVKKNIIETPGLAVANIKDTITIMINPPETALRNIPVKKTAAEASPVSSPATAQTSGRNATGLDHPVPVVSDSSTGRSLIRPVLLSKIEFKTSVTLSEGTFTGNLASINMPVINTSETSQSHSLNGFIARTFREKILKTNDQEKGNLKAYEIVDAGILGLNKLFEWNMSLRKNKNAKGEIKSFYFDSKLLKFNVPVKKTASLL
jgi:hypothetical protein